MSDYYRPCSRVTYVQWDNDIVIYSHGSACTHFISNIPTELVKAMFSGNHFSTNTLVKVVATLFPENNSEQNNHYFQELKIKLISKELIEKE